MRRVVVTGLGAVTPIGNSVSEMWESVKAGKCGIAPITLYDTTDRKVTLAGEVKNFVPEDHLDKREVRKMDRFTQFAMTAAKEAVEDAGFNTEELDLTRCGVIVSTGIGGLTTIQEEDAKGMEKGYDRVSPYFIPMTISNMAAGKIAIEYGFKGMCSCVVTACASGTNAIGDAFRHIRDGYAEMMLCGGTEASITPLGIGGFTSLKALCQSTDPNRASIPFDKERSGFVMGEGAAILVLEEYEHAVKRGAKIYCEVAGYGANCDAHHITAPLEDGSGAAACMRLAMADGNVGPEEINYINAHGTSTPLNDKGETKAIRGAFGEYADKLMVSSTKSMTGHLLGASGAVEGVITALSVKNDFVPATINYKEPDENCDLDIVPNEGRSTTVNYAMSNSLGFGGHNASIIFKKFN
ncbi:MAG: beta-ketoacyl-ACP synthase II [Thermoflexaceae bacterium]|nr:beta-ketoacyl-ACP synthase II [Thermoflexaceae bacterium]